MSARDIHAVRSLERDVRALGAQLRDTPGVDPGLARSLAEAHSRLDALRRRVRQHDLDPTRAERCERAALEWFNGLDSAEQLVEELIPDPAWAGGQPPKATALRVAANVLRFRDSRPRGQVAALSELGGLRGMTAGFAAALLHTGCTRSAAANAPRGAAEVGVMLPLRIETRFDTGNNTVRILVHPATSPGCRAMTRGSRPARWTCSSAMSRWSRRRPPARIRRLRGRSRCRDRRRAGSVADARARDRRGRHVLRRARPPDEDLRTDPAYPSLVGLPDELHVFLAPSGGGAPVDVLTLTLDRDHLAMDLPNLDDPAEMALVHALQGSREGRTGRDVRTALPRRPDRGAVRGRPR